MTAGLSDHEKATRRAIRAVLDYLLATDADDVGVVAFKAFVALTIVGHWNDDGEDECECPVCLGNFTINLSRLRPE